MTSVSERSGMPPIPADTLAKMPPEQRARIEAQLKGDAHNDDQTVVLYAGRRGQGLRLLTNTSTNRAARPS